MKKYIILPLLFALFAGIGCTDLDEELYESIPADQYPENEGQIASLSVDAYSKLKDLIDDQGYWYLAQIITGDGYCAPTRDTDWDDGGKWRVLHQHTWSNDVDAVNNMWSNLYDGVTRSNQVIDRLKTFEQTDDVKKVIAEVETMRAFYYYLLMDNYGDIPYLTSAKDAPEQPFKISREDVFNNLVTELEANVSLLEASDKKYLANQYMAYMLLAKLYLNAEVYTGTPQWQEASDALDEVLAGPYAMATDLMSPFATQNENSSEIIFSIPFDEDTYQGFRLHMRSLHYLHNKTFGMAVGPWNGFAATPMQFDLYEENDLRKTSWMIWGPQYTQGGEPLIDDDNPGWTGDEPFYSELDDDKQVYILPKLQNLWMTTDVDGYAYVKFGGARMKKFEIANGAKESLSNDFPLFRITDAKLMKAETQIRLGNPGDGDDLINEIRDRAGVDDIIGASLDDLLDERGRELWLEGHRRQDLIRFGEFEKQWWEKEAKVGVSTFPIPKWASDANPNLLEEPK
ncbi:RagB/SusD family nutrient uptake outer membrane protein [Marinilabilia salmonicolor]|uniref:RagB/SusD family nutrient uptake outer membrane protein n=1 Tax=Marinilabilia salmonicolor TaxID=989 RepID=UPI00029A7518|nr:RagB/SusD family nutrient uptake outer membrane protein [Marinilabilia salmonicolor]